MVHQNSQLSIGSWNSEECQMTGLWLVVCAMTLARQLQMHDQWCWSSHMEPGDCRVCQEESSTSSVFSIWSAEPFTDFSTKVQLTSIFFASDNRLLMCVITLSHTAFSLCYEHKMWSPTCTMEMSVWITMAYAWNTAYDRTIWTVLQPIAGHTG